jgi:fucose permease
MSAQDRSSSGRHSLLMFIGFLGIFVYGLLAALPGSVLPTLDRSQYVPGDKSIADFLLINAIGAVLAYLVSGPVTDRKGKKFTLSAGAALVIAAMAGFALTVTQVSAGAALPLIFACGFVLGLGANAIVSAGHALVADVASRWRNAALNLLDVFFGLGLMTLPLIVQSLQQRGGLSLIFYSLAAISLLLLLFVAAPRFPRPTHPESFPISEAKELLKNSSFWLLAIALFMYVGAEVAVGKWVVTFIERDAQLLASAGVDAARLQQMSPAEITHFFEQDPAGFSVAQFALRTLSLFAFALLVGRIASSLALGVLRINSFLLVAIGSAITTLGLGVAFTAGSVETARLGLVAAGFGMGPIFPTSVGLASVIVPRIAGTAMSWVMGIGFAGLLLIPPAVGYVSSAVGGHAGDVRTGLMVVLAASVLMLLLHIALAVRERKRAKTAETDIEIEAPAKAG